jgi:diaminopropionate ammonia-lyase
MSNCREEVTGVVQQRLPSLLGEFREIWPDYRSTSLIELPALAQRLKIKSVFVKSEGERPLGNFKVLGGAVAALRALARAVGVSSIHGLATVPPQSLPLVICASDGNHGLAVAAAARRARARARIYLPDGVDPLRAGRITALGGQIHWINGTYDDAVRAARATARRGEGLLIPDTSDDPDDPVVRDVMAGYEILAQELSTQFLELRERPSHVFVQAGVGGLAAAIANRLTEFVRAPERLLVVEPAAAACVAEGLRYGRPVPVSGDLKTVAEMLSCGVASASALQILRAHDAQSVTVAEDELRDAVGVLKEAGGPATTASGAAGLAGLLHVAARLELRAQHQLAWESTALLVASEGPVSRDAGVTSSGSPAE